MTFTATPILDAQGVRDRISAGSPALSDYTDGWIEGVVAEFEVLVERYRGFAPALREQVETVRVAGCPDRLMLSHPRVASITSIVINGSTVDSSLYSFDGRTGFVYYPSRFSQAYPPVVTYQYGLAVADESLLRCCALYVEKCAAADRSTVTGDVRTQGVDFTSFVTADMAAGRPTQWNEVNRLLNMQPDYRILGIA